jgi:hypothetical protein
MVCLDNFIMNQVLVAAWIHIWVFYFVPLIFMSVLCQYHAGTYKQQYHAVYIAVAL